MFSRITLELKSDDEKCIRPEYASIMQSVLMETIDRDYAEYLHNKGYHPYSQYIECGERTLWHINTLSQETYDNIICPVLDKDFDGFTIRKNNMQVKVVLKTVKSVSFQEMLESCIECQDVYDYKLSFITPTAFKNGNEYEILPRVDQIFKSAMKKFVINSDNEANIDENLINDLARFARVTRFNMHSECMPLERQKIPGFVGDMYITVKGSPALRQNASLLLQIAEYTGIGIKCGIGMGAVRVEKR